MLSRRRLLHSGLGAGLAFVTPSSRARETPAAATTLTQFCDLDGWATPVTAAGEPAPTASVAPFQAPLKIPTVLQPVRTDDTTDYYEIVMRPADVEIVPGTTTRIWGYNGEYPGPTIVSRRGRTASVTQRNQLEVPTTVHLHGGHVPSNMDGHPNDLIPPGGSQEYLYPNAQLGATLWYHDHTHHQTAENVYRGLAGLYLIQDDAEDALGLPAGDRDVPLIIQDRTFNPDGSLFYPPEPTNGFFGQTILVNGVPQPHLQVERVRYRFRILNASNARPYDLALSTGQPLLQVATDGGLMPRPVSRASVDVSPAERVEVVVDFSAAPAGSSVVLRDRISLKDVMRFDVGGDAPDPSQVPAELRPLEGLTGVSVTREIPLSFDAARGVWVIDGEPFDPRRIDDFPKLGATEIWRFRNVSHMAHPMHLHLVMFQVIDRDGKPPGPGERGWKDTVNVRAGETVSLITRFDHFTGTYVYHCHNLEHEDHEMMAQLKVVDLPRLHGPDRVSTAAAVSRASFPAGVPVAFVATAADFPDALAGGPAAAVAGGPILLTAGATLPAASARELARLQPQTIVVLGGERAVPRSVEAELRRYTPGTVSRLQGDSRFATAAAISRAHFRPGVPAAYVCSGRSFPDALAGGPGAAVEASPVLLVEPFGLPGETAAELRRLEPGRIVVLGGERAVSREVHERLAAFTQGEVSRLAGSDRYATAAAVSQFAFPLEASTVYVATGADFADGLAGVPAAGRVPAPLLLVMPQRIPDPVAGELRRLAPKRIVILGGAAAVSGEVERKLATFLPD